ncbi:hypothetical protein L1987_84512 [Smallanthus sonchifolius]|uniref:Uncharacterized protein n=1 Tax=Smallanthus sonchifolius TaxID=185202 RepID=A0ACB8YF34_9ASTR|nr:hypothetical protein L1987_84512 [Smallanthus sonchifolius]
MNIQGYKLPYEEMAFPCEDLLDGGRREYLDIAVPLYRASIKGDWKAAKDILKGREYLVRYCITENKETPLHVAAAAGHSTKFVRKLLNMMTSADLELVNGDGNTSFCLAAISGNVGIAKIMVGMNPALPNICGSENKMPLYLASLHGNHDMVTFLYHRRIDVPWTDDDKDAVLLKCIQVGMFRMQGLISYKILISDVALRILEDYEELPQDNHVWDVLQALARKPEAFDDVESWPIISQISSSLTPKSLIVAPQMSVIPNYWERTDEAENSDDPKESLNTLIQLGNHNHWDDELNFHIKNAAGQTPQELFMENHNDLVYRGVNWINRTINQSMVVASLECTIGFSVVYSIPGGFHQENGFPIFLRDRDAISAIFTPR